mmetsp:Transcript_4980/g.8120  ORF Transcript_4980/g.8120 Transcript_4980/m.8120 type:complete len:87 (-) Transcript_4980:4212-4472(-)
MLQADTASANWEQKWNTSLRINVTSTHNALSVDDDTDDLEDVTEELSQSQIAVQNATRRFHRTNCRMVTRQRIDVRCIGIQTLCCH